MKILKPKSAYRVSALALTFGMMAPMAAIAQDGDVAAEAPANEEELKQETVYVTARKREETQLEVPVSVTAFGQDQLDARGIGDASSLSEFVPGFDFEPVGTGGASGRANPQIRFRGVGDQIGDANARPGAIFWDGAFVADGIGIVPLLDLERTEVIKGPQTAFFGRNTFAGAANFIPAQPTDEFYGRLSGGITGTDVGNGQFVNGVISGPITDDLSGRVLLSYEQRAGTDEFQDGSQLGEEETIALIGSLRYEPTDDLTIKYSGYIVGSEDTATLSSILADTPAADCDVTYNGNLRDLVSGEIIGDFSTDLSTGFGNRFCGSIPEFDDDNIQTPAFGGLTPPPGVTTGAFGAATFVLPDEFGSFISAPDGLGNTYRTWRHHLSAEKELDSGLTLAGYISAGKNQNWGVFDSGFGSGAFDFGTFSFVDLNFAGFIRENDDVSAELRLTSSGDQRLRWMIGGSYYTQESLVLQTQFATLNETEADVFGIFGSVDFDVTDEFTISAEGRFQDDESTLVFTGAPGADRTGFEQQSQSFSKFMPRIILRYQPENTGLNIYGSFSQSYLPGSATNAVAFEGATGELGPDVVGFFTDTQRLDAFEIGLKHDVSSSLNYSIAAYQMDWTNQAFFVLSPTFVSVTLPGDSEYTGIEGEINYSPTDWFSIQASYNWVDGEYTDFVATGSVSSAVLAPGLLNNTTAIDASGNEIRYNPEHTGAIGFDFDVSDFVGRDAFFRTDVIYTGSFFTDNFEFNEVDAATRVNLRAGVGVNDWLNAELFGTNIFDDRTSTPSGGTTSGTDFVSRRFFGQAPRGAEWGFRLTAEY